MKLKFTALVGALTLFSFAVKADTIDLKGGSKLNGKITNITKESVKISTDFAGDLVVKFDKIMSFQTDEPIHTGTGKGKIEQAKVSFAAGKMTVANGVHRKTVDAVQAAWANEDDNPFVETPKDLWNFSAGLNLTGKTGNSEKFRAAGAVDAVRKTADDKLKFYANYARGKSGKIKDEDQLIGGIDYEHNMSERTAWYTRAEFEKDDVENLTLRTTVASGIGYYFYNEPGNILRGRAGLAYRKEQYTMAEGSDSIGLDLGLYHKYKIKEWGTLVNDLTYIPSLEDAADYRAILDTSLELPFATMPKLSLNIGCKNEYTSIIHGNTKRLDTTYYLRLKYSW